MLQSDSGHSGRIQWNPVESSDQIPVDSTGFQTEIEIEQESGCIQTVVNTNIAI